MEEKPIVLFDGVCNFCNYWIRFAIKHDRKGKLRFASLQGESAKLLLPTLGINPSSITSVVLIQKGSAYTQSSAVFRICRHLDGGWKLLYGFMIFPKFLRDGIYNWIARNRYKWFGKKEACMIPTPEQRTRFLD